MVDSINNRHSSLPSKLGESKLRNNFKDLTSKVSLSSVKVQETAASNSREAGPKVQANKLNDAVSFSKLALKSLDDLSGNGSEGVERSDIDQIKADIQNVLSKLNHKAVRAEVAAENVASAESQIRDIDLASKAAQNTSAQIGFGASEAINAHTGLTPERVASLLEI